VKLELKWKLRIRAANIGRASPHSETRPSAERRQCFIPIRTELACTPGGCQESLAVCPAQSP
jgi:hypothetical protein